MRIFIVQNCKPSSGEWKANTSFLKFLTSKGHVAAQFCYSSREELEKYIELPEIDSQPDGRFQQHILPISRANAPPIDIVVTSLNDIDGIQTIAVDRAIFQHFTDGDMVGEIKAYIETNDASSTLLQLSAFLQAQIALFQPTHILFSDPLTLKLTSLTTSSSSTPPHLNLTKNTGKIRRVYMLHSAEQLPTGPFAGGLPGTMDCDAAASLLKGVDGTWAMSEALKTYVTDYANLENVSVFAPHIWTYLLGNSSTGRRVPDGLHNGDKDIVAMVNPSDIKGVGILLGLAQKLPGLKFVVWKSWAMDKETLGKLERTKNVEVRETVADMETVWETVKVLLIPSLWFEAWGLVTVEAQLRGIPVISSNVGGIPEAKLGLPYILPVNPLTGEHDDSDRYIIPSQDTGPWVETLEKLMRNRELYEKLSSLARERTLKWINEIDTSEQEKWLENL